MLLSRVTGVVWATRKDPTLEGHKLLIVQPVNPDQSPAGSSLLALDRVDAGEGDLVLVNKEGSGARLLYGSNQIPVQAVVVGVVDRVEISNP